MKYFAWWTSLLSAVSESTCLQDCAGCGFYLPLFLKACQPDTVLLPQPQAVFIAVLNILKAHAACCEQTHTCARQQKLEMSTHYQEVGNAAPRTLRNFGS